MMGYKILLFSNAINITHNTIKQKTMVIICYEFVKVLSNNSWDWAQICQTFFSANVMACYSPMFSTMW